MSDDRVETPVEALARQMDKPSLVALSYALRHPASWPKGFDWDYSDCSQCAIGLAYKLWLGKMSTFSTPHAEVSVMAREFEMSWQDADRIFRWAHRPQNLLDWRHFVPRTLISVTPDRVADLIDAHLNREGAVP